MSLALDVALNVVLDNSNGFDCAASPLQPPIAASNWGLAGLQMLVAVVRVWIVGVCVAQVGMDVCVDVRLARRVIWVMRMPMMRVVNMRMSMLHRLMDVIVRVAFGEVQPHAYRHQRSRHAKAQGDRCAENDNGDHSADEGRGGKIGARAT